MATIYMLHLKHFHPRLQPKDDDGGVGVTRARRPLLKGYGNWVKCRCKGACEVQWNFVNDLGLHMGGAPGRCALARFLDSGKLGWLSNGQKEQTARDETFEAWKKMTIESQ